MKMLFALPMLLCFNITKLSAQQTKPLLIDSIMMKTKKYNALLEQSRSNMLHTPLRVRIASLAKQTMGLM